MKRMLMLLVVCLLLLAPVMGCAKGEKIALREAMHQSTSEIRREHLEWTREKARAGELNVDDLRIRENSHKRYEELVAADRKND